MTQPQHTSYSTESSVSLESDQLGQRRGRDFGIAALAEHNGKAEGIMTRLHITGLMLLAALAFSVTAASPASALTSQFLLDGLTFTENEKATGEKEVTIDYSSTSILFATVGGINTICTKVTGTGTITGATTDLISTVAFANCTAAGLACTVAMDNLTWATELTLVGTEFLDFILKEPTGGTPGWLTECLGIDVLCEFKLLVGGAENYSVDLSNIAGGTIDMEFLEVEQAGPCFENGKEITADQIIVGLATVECLDKNAAKLECSVSEA